MAKCEWPICLDDEKAKKLCDNIIASELGKETEKVELVCDAECELPETVDLTF